MNYSTRGFRWPGVVLCLSIFPCIVLGRDAADDYADPLAITQGILQGPVADLCGEFVVNPDDGYDYKVIRVSCSAEDWAFWFALVGVRITVEGTDVFESHGCGLAGVGGWHFCVDEVSTPTEASSWGTLKAMYR